MPDVRRRAELTRPYWRKETLLKFTPSKLFAATPAILIAWATLTLIPTTAHALTVSCQDTIFASNSGHCDPGGFQVSAETGPGPEFTVSGLGAVVPHFNGMTHPDMPNPILIDVALNSVTLSLRDPIPPPDPVIGNVSWSVIPLCFSRYQSQRVSR